MPYKFKKKIPLIHTILWEVLLLIINQKSPSQKEISLSAMSGPKVDESIRSRTRVSNFVLDVGEHKLNFIPAMIGPFLEVTLVPQPDLRNVMIPIFHDMMDWEQRRSGNFKQVGHFQRLPKIFICILRGDQK